MKAGQRPARRPHAAARGAAEGGAVVASRLAGQRGKKGAMPPALDQPAFRERQDIRARNDQVIQHPNVDQPFEVSGKRSAQA